MSHGTEEEHLAKGGAVLPPDFRKQTPRICIGDPIVDPLYEKAFLLPRPEADHEYDRNTATWD